MADPETRGSLIFTALVLFAVVATGALTYDRITSEKFQHQIDQDTAEAQAYCAQVYGDSGVYSAAVVGRHGGLHCVANQNGPHLHAIPEEYQEQAYQAQQRGEDLGWTVDTAKQQADPAPMFPMLGQAVVLAVIMFVVVGAIGAIQSWRNGDSLHS